MIEKSADEIVSFLGTLGAQSRVSIPDGCSGAFTDLAASSTEAAGGALFAAFPGSSSDGRKYIPDALRRGAAGVIFELSGEGGDFAHPDGVASIGVRELRKFIPALASFFFDHPADHLHLLGVTGTNGKSSTAWYAALLIDEINKRREEKGLQPLGRCGIIGTVGNGFPGDLHHTANTTPGPVQLEKELRRQLDLGASRCLMEVSSQGIAGGRIEGVPFRGSAFTNLSRDHLDFHKTMEAYAEVKWSFVRGDYGNLPVINQDDAVGRKFTSRLEAEGRKVLTFGEAGDGIVPALSFTDGAVAGNGISFTVRYKDTKRQVTLPLIGRFNIYNALTAAGMLISDGADAAEVLDALPALRPLVGRMEMFSKEGSPLVIVDFAHTPDGIEKSLMAAREHTKGILTCVFGAGGDRDHGKRPLMAASAEKFADRVFVTDDNPRSEDPAAIRRDVAAGFTGALNDVGRKALVRTDFADRAAAIREAILSSKEGDTVAVLGKGHEEFQIVGKKMLPWSDQKAVREILGL